MRKCDDAVTSEVEIIYLKKGLWKKNGYKMEKGREANENTFMEEKPHGMRKVRVMHEQKFKRTNLPVRGVKLKKKKKVAGEKKVTALTSH